MDNHPRTQVWGLTPNEMFHGRDGDANLLVFHEKVKQLKKEEQKTHLLAVCGREKLLEPVDAAVVKKYWRD